MTFLWLGLAILVAGGSRRPGHPHRSGRSHRSGHPRRRARDRNWTAPGSALAAGLLGALLSGPAAWLVAPTAAAAAWWLARRLIRPAGSELDRRDLAVLLDLIAAALSTGVAPESAIGLVERAVTQVGDGALLHTVAPLAVVGRLLELGSDPGLAWHQLDEYPELAPVAAAGRRCAHSGARLTGALTEVAGQLRDDAMQRQRTRAQRAGVLALLPLGCCFLPAFICLGVVPVVIGVGRQFAGSGLLPR